MSKPVESVSNRRSFLGAAVGTSLACTAAARAERKVAAPGSPLDTHMHVWAGDLKAYPFAHPYQPNFKPPKTAATAELLIEEMNRFGLKRCILVQTIYHGWDNRYLVACLKAHPQRFRGQGLIDPTDPHVADKLDYWMTSHGLAGMRLSPIYYRGKDEWMTSKPAHALWKKAEKLGAVFNFFIATQQLPKLEQMVRQYPGVKVVIDHLARIDLKTPDPLPEFKKLLVLAKYPNVWAKVSELCEISPSRKYPFTDTFPWVRRMYDAFGPDRLLWGTGFPGVTRVEAHRPTLEQELNLIRNEIKFFTAEDREKILGRNALKVWRFDDA